MSRNELNRISGTILIVLSLLALLTVLSGYLQPPQPQTDEGAAAHIFQLSVAACVFTLLAFCATADWSKPLCSARPLLVSGVALALAFGALYYLEHYRLVAH
jgi:hypothetical protein